jgi:adenosine deaminase
MLMEAIQKGVYEAAARGLELQVIIDTVRQWGPQHVEETLRLHHQHPVPCVVAFGMGGNETAYPPAAFESAFAWARQSGLRTVVHSGESGNAASIRDTLDVLKPDRIMHGIRAIDDALLVEHLAACRTPLDVCPTSNVCTGVVAHLKEHPVRRLYEAGVSISVNTDDPPMFNTTLNREYELLLTEFNFSPEELFDVAQSAFKNSFLPASRKAGYLQAQEMIWRAFREGR